MKLWETNFCVRVTDLEDNIWYVYYLSTVFIDSNINDFLFSDAKPNKEEAKLLAQVTDNYRNSYEKLFKATKPIPIYIAVVDITHLITLQLQMVLLANL